MTDSIGGYFELDLRNNEPYHPDVIEVNTGRNALEYILSASDYTSVLLPYYTCEVLLEPIVRLGLAYSFYHIDDQLQPILPNELEKGTVLLYVNYFGIKNDVVHHLSQQFEHLIIDNSQAFYDCPVGKTSTFYSPRKFFGLPDGGLVSTPNKLDTNLTQDTSHNRMSHLLKRIDLGAEAGYGDFVKNDAQLINQPLKLMSNLTSSLMRNLSYEESRLKRMTNFERCYTEFETDNKLNISISTIQGPLVYPLLISNGKQLKEHLIREKIFVATYWENMRPYIKPGGIEFNLIDHLVPLPIDQRMSNENLSRMIEIVKTYIKSL